MREDAFKSGEKCGYKQTSAMLTALKQDVNYAFLKEVDSIALQQALRNLDTGYTNFFEHMVEIVLVAYLHDCDRFVCDVEKSLCVLWHKTNIDFSSIAVELQQAYNNGKGDDNHDHNCTKHQQLPHKSVLW